jgi:hypothetical protein
MNQSDQHPTRDFIGGLLLVPLLHILFVIMSAFLLPIVPFSSILVFGIGLSQFLYLMPFIVKYGRRDRLEVVKGILVSAVITIMLSGICGTFVRANAKTSVLFWDIALAMTLLGAIVIGATAFHYFKPRSRPK